MGQQNQRCHGRAGHSHEWSGAVLGLFWVSWQPVHPFATSSIALSIPGHHMQLLAKAFILTIPRWPSRSSANSCAWCLGGIITREPHIRQPSCMVSSSFLLWNGSSSFSLMVGHPCFLFSITRDKTGSLWVACRIISALTGSTSIWDTWKISTGLTTSLSQAVFRGRRDYPSAFPCCVVFLYSILYSNPARNNA